MNTWTRQVIALFFSGLCSLGADTIRSVPGGGLWSDTLAWVGAAIPDTNDDVVIRGTVSVNAPASCRNLTVADSAILQNGGSAGHVTLAVTGSITNNGTLRNNPDSNNLWLELHGDCTNNGTWTPARTFFASRAAQTIAQSPESDFGGALYKTDTAGVADTFPLVAASDLAINAQTFDGNGRAGSKSWLGTVDMAGHTLQLSGGTAFTGATVYNINMITFYDSSTVSSCTFESSVMISGICTVIDSKVLFNGDVGISGGTLQNGATSDSSVVVRFKGIIVNNGLLSNNPNGNELWLELYGDLYNAGTWKPARTYIASKIRQTISQISQSRFEGLFFATAADSSTDTFPLVAASDLWFHGGDFECSKNGGGTRLGKLDMAGFNLLLTGGAYFQGAVVSQTARVTCLDSAMIGNCVFENPVQACGNFKVAVQGVYFNDTLTVVDTLENGAAGCCVAQGILFARNGIVNKGVIRNNPKQFELWCQIGRNITNAGTWSNARTILSDSVDQVVTLENGKPIGAPFQFDGMWPGGPYTWQKNGQDLEGDTVRFLLFDSLTELTSGTYRCGHNGSWSRTIMVVWDTAVGVAGPGKPIRVTPPSASGCVIVFGKAPSVRFHTPYACRYSMAIHDIRGRLVAFTGAAVSSGYHSVAIPGNGLAVGTYTVLFRSAHFQKAMRMAIAR
ncbi:MAG: hypothetical protein JXA71_15590 [Chitinispirillaceae bacterium]|nr:hypothetical protein [Chitinispirillaceae bacterium]